MHRKVVLFLMPVLGLALVLAAGLAAASLQVGAQFGNLKFSRTLCPADQQYLGLKTSGPFTLSDLQADYVLLEVLNVNCPHCIEQAAAMNRLYRLVEGSNLKGRMKFIGVVSNSEGATNRWRRAYKVPFALVADPEWQIAGILGVTGTPTTVVVNKKGKVLILHDGVFGDANKAFGELKARLK